MSRSEGRADGGPSAGGSLYPDSLSPGEGQPLVPGATPCPAPGTGRLVEKTGRTRATECTSWGLHAAEVHRVRPWGPEARAHGQGAAGSFPRLRGGVRPRPVPPSGDLGVLVLLGSGTRPWCLAPSSGGSWCLRVFSQDASLAPGPILRPHLTLTAPARPPS